MWLSKTVTDLFSSNFTLTTRKNLVSGFYNVTLNLPESLRGKKHLNGPCNGAITWARLTRGFIPQFRTSVAQKAADSFVSAAPWQLNALSRNKRADKLNWNFTQRRSRTRSRRDAASRLWSGMDARGRPIRFGDISPGPTYLPIVLSQLLERSHFRNNQSNIIN